MLFGRQAHCVRIDRLLEQVSHGASGVLVVCGDAGIGKTSLLRYAMDRADGVLVLSVAGVESEAMFPFAALGRLLHPVLEHLTVIPPRQAAALRGALAMEEPRGGGDRFAVYAAAFGVVAAAAQTSRILTVVDDAQWLDQPSAEAVGFVARRLRDEGVGVLIGTRDVAGFDEFEMLPVTGLDSDAVGELLRSQLAVEPTLDVVWVLAQDLGGNPLALTEIAATLSVDQVAGRRPLPTPLPAHSTASRIFGPRLAALTPGARQALQVAVVAGGDGFAVVLTALDQAGLSRSELGRLEEAGLIHLADGELHLRHPLLRPAALVGMSRRQLRAVHQQLAEVLSAPGQAQRRAWHLAQAALGPDEATAAALEHAATLANARSGYAAAALAFQHAARLSPDEQAAARRYLAAALAAASGGQPEQALHLLGEAEGRTSEILLEAAIAQTRGRIELFTGNASGARQALQTAAAAVSTIDPQQASSLLATAAEAAYAGGDPAGTVELAHQALGAGAHHDQATHARVRLMLGLSLPQVGQVREGLAELETLAGMFDGAPDTVENETIVYAAQGLVRLGEAARARQLLAPVLQDLRTRAGLGTLPFALYSSALAETRLGYLTRAAAAATEAADLAATTGNVYSEMLALGCLAVVEAQRGNEEACRTQSADALKLRGSTTIDLGRLAMDALGLLELSLGRADRAIGWLEQSNDANSAVGPSLVARRSCFDLIEAYVRSNRPIPAQLVDQLRFLEGLSGPAPLVALSCRGLALLAEDQDFDKWFTRALEWHVEAPEPFETVRTRLCYGQRLRRASRRREAQHNLRLALDGFQSLGARLWAQQAGTELTAAGQPVQEARPREADTLTAQEYQVAQAAAAGATNQEIATQMFLSIKTIEMHLGRVYRKLGVRSRTQLANLLHAGQPV